MASDTQPSGYRFFVSHNMGGGCRRRLELILIGGYAIDRTTIVIFRDPSAAATHCGGGGGKTDGGGGTSFGLLELRTNSVMRLLTEKSRSAIDLAAGDAERFVQLPEYYQFMLGKRWWRKLPIEQLSKRLRSREWHTV